MNTHPLNLALRFLLELVNDPRPAPVTIPGPLIYRWVGVYSYI